MGFYSMKHTIQRFGKVYQITPTGNTYNPATSTVSADGTPISVEAYLGRVNHNDSRGFVVGNYALSFVPEDTAGNTFQTPKVGDYVVDIGKVLNVREYKKGDEVLVVALEVQG